MACVIHQNVHYMVKRDFENCPIMFNVSYMSSAFVRGLLFCNYDVIWLLNKPVKIPVQCSS